MVKRAFLIVVSFLFIGPAFSQSTSIGGSIAYGGSYIDYLPSFRKLFGSAFENVEIGALVSYRPKDEDFLVNSGITYLVISTPTFKLDFLKIPLNWDLVIGKKYQVLFGLGIYGKALTHQSENEFYDFSTYQFGYNVNFGLGFNFNEKHSIFVSFRKDNDLSKLYSEETPSHFGAGYDDNYYLHSYNVNLCYTFTLSKMKNNRQ